MAETAPIKIKLLGVDLYTKEFSKLTKRLHKIGTATANLGRKMTTALTLPIVGIGIASTKMATTFNASMANVGSLIAGQTDKLNRFKTATMALSKDLAVNENVMAAGLYQTISAVGDTSDVMESLGIAAKAAKAGVAATADSVNLLTKVSAAYGDQSAPMIQRVSDLSFLAVKLGVTTFPELAASMGSIASTAQGMDVSMVELFADTAALTKVMGDTSQAATAMDSVMSGLMLGGTDLDRVFSKLGVKSGNELIKKFGGLTNALSAMKAEVGGSEIALKKLFGRKEAQKAAGLLTGSLSEAVTINTKAMKNASGATQEAFDAQTKGINKAGFAFDKFVQKLRITAITIGDRLAPKLMILLDRIDPLIDKLSSLSGESLTFGIKVAGVVAAIGPLLFIMGKLTTAFIAIKALVVGAGGFAAIGVAITGPVGIAVAAIAAAVGAITYFWDELKPLRSALMEPIIQVFNDVKEVFASTGTAGASLGKLLKDLVSAFSTIAAPVAKFGTKLVLLPMRHIIKVTHIAVNIFHVLGSAFGVVTSAVRLGIAWLGKLWIEFTTGTTVGKAIKTVFDAIGGAIDWVVEIVKGAWDEVGGFFENVTVALDAVGIQLDKAADKQNTLNEAALLGSASMNGASLTQELTTDQTVINSIEKGKSEIDLTIALDGLPSGTSAKVQRSKGAKTKVKSNGRSNEGEL